MAGDEQRSRRRQNSRPLDDEPVLPRDSADETAERWGDEPDERDDAWYRRERPPHHE